MNDLLFLDTETFSPTPIAHGSHRYAEDAEIMVASWAFGVEGEAQVADLWTPDGRAQFREEVLPAIQDPGVTIIGQNFGNFDRVLARAVWGTDIPPERIHDLMVQALSHGLPGALGKLGEIFGLNEEEAKMKEGRDLIQLFCKPRPKNMALRRATPLTHPEQWKQFLEYARRDIPPMQRLYRMLPNWNYPGDTSGNSGGDEHRLWCIDQRINDRGFKVDLDLAESAIKAIALDQKRLSARTVELTDDEVQRTSQRDKLLKHLLSYYDVELPDMTKSTLEKRVNDPDLPEPVRELLAIRLESTQTSTSKYAALLRSVSSDGRLRGTIQFCGASRTGRDAGRIFQPQNLLRPTMKAHQIETAISVLKRGAAPLFYDSPITVAANAVRGCIVADEGHKLVVADLSNIEGRVLAWLAGEKWKLQAFRDYDTVLGYDDKGKAIRKGPDLYLLTAGDILGKEPEEVTDDERQSTGKVPELACGYQGAQGAFASMAALYGLELDDDVIDSIVKGWRAKNANIVKFWYALQEAAWTTVQTGQETHVGKISFSKRPGWLKMHLPSGRVLAYADPKIVPDPRAKGRSALSYMGLDSYTKRWKRLYTYGGKLAENATQAVARDVLKAGVERAEAAGLPIILPVHDELVTEPVDEAKYSVSLLAECMSRLPWWADNELPLAAAGWEGYRYRKG